MKELPPDQAAAPTGNVAIQVARNPHYRTKLAPFRLFNPMQIAPLRARKSSELLVVMLKLLPRGLESSPFFAFFFWHRLPRELRVLLSEEDHTNKRSVAENADRFWAHNVRHSHDVVAAVRGESGGVTFL
jgi:hypothetical protein